MSLKKIHPSGVCVFCGRHRNAIGTVIQIVLLKQGVVLKQKKLPRKNGELVKSAIIYKLV